MYHSWGSQNAWLRQIHGENPLYVPGALWEALGFEEGDWADLISPHARMTVPVARMDALNPWTVWTWNAIGKRPGAWALVARRAGGDPRLPAQPPDPRSPPRPEPARQRRPGHRPGRLVRPARTPRARPGADPQPAGDSGAGVAGRPRQVRTGRLTRRRKPGRRKGCQLVNSQNTLSSNINTVSLLVRAWTRTLSAPPCGLFRSPASARKKRPSPPAERPCPRPRPSTSPRSPTRWSPRTA